ncbi:MAG: hypothetical protein C0483_18240 [Pirellula sp.]|nr:hypothetical protein [Pirellula sp.]
MSMPTATFGADQLGDLLVMIPLGVALGAALCGGALIRRRFDTQAAVCALPLLTISGYNVALVALLALGFLR